MPGKYSRISRRFYLVTDCLRSGTIRSFVRKEIGGSPESPFPFTEMTVQTFFRKSKNNT